MKQAKKGLIAKCIITGKRQYFSQQVLKGKIKKFGSIESFIDHNISIPARKLLRQGKTVEEVREELNVTENLPEIDLKVLARLKLLKKPKKHKQHKLTGYLESPEYHKKKAERDKTYNVFNSERYYIEWLTGNQLGGTCHRPDIYLYDHCCNNCKFSQYCLCENKEFS